MFYNVARVIARVIAWIFMPYRAYGSENVPTEGAVILCANHISDTDPVFLGLSIKRHIRFIAKKEVMNVPVLGWLLHCLGAFPVDREGKDLQAVRNCMRVLKDGDVLGIFPEGTRVIKNRVSDAKAGIALIAKKSKATIVMVHIKPKHGRFRVFSRTDLYFSKPYTYDELCGDLELQAASKKILDSIYALGE